MEVASPKFEGFLVSLNQERGGVFLARREAPKWCEYSFEGRRRSCRRREIMLALNIAFF